MNTFRQVAEKLGCSLSNVYGLKDAGLLAVVPTGAGGKGYRVTDEELERFIRERREHRGKDAGSFPKSSDPCPKNATRRFEHLDGARLLAAWQKQGVISGRPDEDNAPSA